MDINGVKKRIKETIKRNGVGAISGNILQRRLIELADYASDITDSTYIWEQTEASKIWMVNHGLNRYPSVSVVDSAGNLVYGDVRYIDENTIQLEFSGEFVGRAYLN